MGLKRIIRDQITQQQRPLLGDVQLPAVKPVYFRDFELTNRIIDQSIQWTKKSYIKDRSFLDELNSRSFSNYSGKISVSTLRPVVDGSLIDDNLPQYTNAQYSVDVYSDINKDYTFKFSMSNQTNCYVYLRRIMSDGSFATSRIGTLTSSGSLLVELKAKEWTTIIVYVYYYGGNNAGSINAFNFLSNVATSWRIPEVQPPSIPQWASTPIITGTNGLTGETFNTLQWLQPDDRDWAGNGIYYRSILPLSDTLLETNAHDNMNAVVVDALTSTAALQYSAGIPTYFNSQSVLYPTDSFVLHSNAFLNSTFTDTSGVTDFNNFTTSVPAGAIIESDFSKFYTRGVSLRGYTPAGSKVDTFIDYDNAIPVANTEKYALTFGFLNSAGAGTGLVRTEFLKSDGVSQCSNTSLGYFWVGSPDVWTDMRVLYHSHTSKNTSTSVSTSKSFKLPSDCANLKFRFYFQYDTSAGNTTNLDYVNFSRYSSEYHFNRYTTAYVAVKINEQMQRPDTPYIKAHITFDTGLSDYNNGVLGTGVGTAVFMSSAYFAKFGSALQCGPKSKNFIVNGHFSNGLTNWTNNGLYHFATSATALYGSYSLKIGGHTSINMYVSQNVSISGGTTKSFSCYVKPFGTRSMKVYGTDGGGFNYTYSFHTSNWQRVLLPYHTTTSLRIYPSSATPSPNSYMLIDGIHLQEKRSTVAPYNPNHINGTDIITANYARYVATDVYNSNNGTVMFWYQPHFNSTSINAGIYGSEGGDLFFMTWDYKKRAFELTNGIVLRKFRSHSVWFRAGEWVFISHTWNGSSSYPYVNGTACSLVSGQNVSFVPSLGNMAFGQTLGISACGVIDDLRFEGCTYSQEQIKQEMLAKRMACRG